jgi:methionyl-tRNA formyltransferase
LDGKLLKIFKATIQSSNELPSPGTFQSDGKTFLRFAATNGWLYLKDIQLEGKKRMGVEDFLRGHRFP